MKLSESLKKWEEFGLKQQTELRKLHYNDLIVHKGNSSCGIIATYKDILEKKFSKIDAPLQVCWIREENKFLVIDGYHRLTQYLLEGKINYLCEVDWTGYSLEWRIPLKEERFVIKGLTR